MCEVFFYWYLVLGPPIEINNTVSSFDKQELSVSERPELTAAKVVISGGKYIN